MGIRVAVHHQHLLIPRREQAARNPSHQTRENLHHRPRDRSQSHRMGQENPPRRRPEHRMPRPAPHRRSASDPYLGPDNKAYEIRLISSAVSTLGERNSYPIAPGIIVIPAAPRPSSPRKWESIAPAAPPSRSDPAPAASSMHSLYRVARGVSRLAPKTSQRDKLSRL